MAASPVPTLNQPAAVPSVLFVDDEPAILTALRVAFRKGYQVFTSTDGEEALQMLAEKPIDVIVCDQRMPRLTGTEVLEQAKAVSPCTVRMLLTGYADNVAVMSAVNAGEVHRYIQKPWDNTALRKMVGEAVETSRQLRSADIKPAWSLHEHLDGAEQAQDARIFHFPGGSKRGPDVGTTTLSGSNPEAVRPPLEEVLVIEPEGRLYGELVETGLEEFDFRWAGGAAQASSLMTHRPSRVVLFVLSADSETQRNFLKALKTRHPEVIVIVVCDSVDSVHLIELINQARIFRFVRQPISILLLSRHLRSAAMLARQISQQPVMARTQRAEPPPAVTHFLDSGLDDHPRLTRAAKPQQGRRGWLQAFGDRLLALVKR